MKQFPELRPCHHLLESVVSALPEIEGYTLLLRLDRGIREAFPKLHEQYLAEVNKAAWEAESAQNSDLATPASRSF
jgi:hypothetical protein